MKLQLASISFLSFEEDVGEPVGIRARVEIVIPQNISATGDIELNLEISREDLGKMTFNEISEMAIQKAADALAASK